MNPKTTKHVYTAFGKTKLKHSQMDTINLGIVIPTLNSEKYIEDTLRSVTPLMNMGAKIIAVDSGSRDMTLEILNMYQIHHIYCPKGNMYEAVNYGFKILGTQKWLTYINSDDILCHNNIKEALFQNDTIDIIYSSIVYFSEKKVEYTYKRLPPWAMKLALMYNLNVFPQPGTLFSQNLYNCLGGFDENLTIAADHDFFTRAFLGDKKAIHYRKPLAKMRLHQEQLSRISPSLNKLQMNTIANKNNLKNSIIQKTAIRIYGRSRNLFKPIRSNKKQS